MDLLDRYYDVQMNFHDLDYVIVIANQEQLDKESGLFGFVKPLEIVLVTHMPVYKDTCVILTSLGKVVISKKYLRKYKPGYYYAGGLIAKGQKLR